MPRTRFRALKRRRAHDFAKEVDGVERQIRAIYAKGVRFQYEGSLAYMKPAREYYAVGDWLAAARLIKGLLASAQNTEVVGGDLRKPIWFLSSAYKSALKAEKMVRTGKRISDTIEVAREVNQHLKGLVRAIAKFY